MIRKALEETFKGRLTRRLLAAVVKICLFMVIVTTLIQVAFENYHRRQHTDDVLKAIVQSHLPLMVRAVENKDMALLGHQIKNLVETSAISFAVVDLNEQRWKSAGLVPEGRRIGYQETRLANVDGDMQAVALRIVMEFPLFSAAILKDAVLLLGLDLLEIFTIAIALLITVHVLVIQHLNRLADYVRSLDVRRLTKPLVFDRVTTNDELQDVSDATNTMTMRLAQTYDDLQQFNYFASHDLQEPLRKVCIFGDVLKESIETGNRDDMEYSIGVMQDSADRASNLVADLLAFSRISYRDSQSAWVPLETIVTAALENNQDEIETAEMRVISNLRDLSVKIDRGMGTQLFDNLVSNSIKYRHLDRPSFLHITADMDEASVLKVFVEDNGIGFDNHHLDKIFEPFKRLHQRSNFAGSGIGLAIVRKIVERAGWSVTAHAEAGGGATFVVTIPAESVRDGRIKMGGHRPST